jgi:hypothetical protein
MKRRVMMRSSSSSSLGQVPGAAKKDFENHQQITLLGFFKAVLAAYCSIAAARHAPDSPKR